MNETSMEITLPYPPTVNTYWRHNRGKTHISSAGRNYRKAVYWRVLKPKRDGAIPTGGFTGELAVEVDVFFPDHRQRDLDNLTKALLDAMEHAGVYADDCQIKRLLLQAKGVESGGMVIVRVGRRF